MTEVVPLKWISEERHSAPPSPFWAVKLPPYLFSCILFSFPGRMIELICSFSVFPKEKPIAQRHFEPCSILNNISLWSQNRSIPSQTPREGEVVRIKSFWRKDCWVFSSCPRKARDDLSPVRQWAHTGKQCPLSQSIMALLSCASVLLLVDPSGLSFLGSCLSSPHMPSRV